MEGRGLFGTAAIIAGLALAARGAADRLRLSAILVLTPAGLAAGPGLGWIEPTESFRAALLVAKVLLAATVLGAGAGGLIAWILHAVRTVVGTQCQMTRTA